MITEGSKAKGQDDLTRKLQDVLKKASIVRALLKKSKPNGADKTLVKAIEDLQYDYAVFLNNELKGVPQDTQRSGAPIRGVAQRIKTKAGLIRNNLMGKRVDYSARTVISADPNLDVDEIGVPFGGHHLDDAGDGDGPVHSRTESAGHQRVGPPRRGGAD